eukprot:7527476-Ditylum_brightwellii.AAC.1
MVKENKLHSNFRSFMNKGEDVYEGACQTCSGFWTEQAQPQHTIATQCTKGDLNLHQSKPASWAPQ